MPDVSAGVCTECGAPVAATDNFCERCGRDLANAVASAGSGRDHVEIDLGGLAGVTDRGMRHSRNEDAMALTLTQTSAGPAALAVVSDGVSTSHRPDEASLAAAREAMRVLTAEVRAGTPAVDALAAATAAAFRAVGDLPAESGDAPATTIVSACVTGDAVAICWVGDSRAYWLPADDSDPRLLTRDDSLGEALVAAGALTETEAVRSGHGHVLTRWLGADAGHFEPHMVSLEPTGPGTLLLCSDGLWNYQPSAAGLAALMPRGGGENLAGAIAALLEFALDRGGEDNITAVLASFPPR